jgi:glycosyltransferase involved in cell wall biosynthesis/Flp pilus assembly protein TadD
MALRLTDSLPAADAAPSVPAPEAIGAVLHARAQRLLAAGDIAAYRALFTEAGDIADVHRRHQAQLGLLDAGLSAPGTKVSVIAPIFAAVAESAVALLEQDPREPHVVNLAGVAFYELGELSTAERLFTAAQRMDPELPNVSTNLEQIARRRRQGLVTRPNLPAIVAARMKELRDRAKRCADRARPATGMTMSLCMIVKDEESMLGQCLAAVKDHVDEIVVVDTGSTDRTMEIAREHGARVVETTWTGDFSAARNVSFDAATSDWILYLDADEVLADEDGPRLRELSGRTWREAFYLIETNHTGDMEDGTAVTHNALRVFRNRPEYRFEGRIHEQIAHTLPGFLVERFEVTGVRIEHYGYLGAVRDAKEKSRRNIDLLEAQIADGVESPFLHFNLGSEYAAVGDSERARDEFLLSWEQTATIENRATFGFLPSLTSRLVRALRICGQHEEAVARGDEALQLLPGFTDIVFEQAMCARALGDDARAEVLLERCLEWGDAPSSYSATNGCGTFLAMAALGDLRRDQGRMEEAERLFREALVTHPRFLSTVDPLASLMLARGAEPESVVALIHDTVGTPSPAARFMLAMSLYEARAVELAEVELRGVLDKQPESGPARLALIEALLSQSRYEDAAQEAQTIEPDAAFGAEAARAAAFALLAAGKADEAAAAVEAARTAELFAPEIVLLDAWRAIVAGEQPPATLPAESSPALFVMLEALLRVTDIDAFVTLVPLADAVSIPWRHRKERLAQLYFRRGFLESAADEWIAVCEGGVPDADALAGLSWVAVGRELPDDARMLADEALTLQPDHAWARAARERVPA